MNGYQKITRLIIFIIIVLISCSGQLETKSDIPTFSYVRNAEEIKLKEQIMSDFLKRNQLDAFLIGTQRNFSWITGGGDNHVVFGTEDGAAILLWSASEKYVIVPTNEKPRIIKEEINGLNYRPITYDWFKLSSTGGQTKAILQHVLDKKVGADFDFPGTKNLSDQFAKLRYQLTPSEIERYTWLGRACAQIVESSCRELEPGMTEEDIQAIVSKKLLEVGIVPTVLLIGVDDRIFNYKHAITKSDTLEKYAMINICAKKWGLIIAVTRFVHFGGLSDQLATYQNHVTNIYASILSQMIPGEKVANIFKSIQEAYAIEGFPDAWKEHHMGGAIGYKEREYKAYPDCDYLVMKNQAFAWNPTLPGVKVEDTNLVTDQGIKTLTKTGDWIYKIIEKDGHVFEIPQILIKR